ncbi:MAG: indole-3-glycerol phosphate synthase TrpC [Chthoniobacterales bacterium]
MKLSEQPQKTNDGNTVLDRILDDVRAALNETKTKRPLREIKARLLDVPPVRSFTEALRQNTFSLIAEVKAKSPSVGEMRPENLKAALPVYESCPVVSAVSILTNERHFGQSIDFLEKARPEITKPLLRKDFIVEEYQVSEARAFGADAILLMANVLDAARLRGFYDLARELGMNALFEVHTEEELSLLPHDAEIIGINSRKFKSRDGFVLNGENSSQDFSVNLSTFDLVKKLPDQALRIAESGLDADNVRDLTRDFHAGLVGTSLLRDPRGIEVALQDFSQALTS